MAYKDSGTAKKAYAKELYEEGGEKKFRHLHYVTCDDAVLTTDTTGATTGGTLKAKLAAIDGIIGTDTTTTSISGRIKSLETAVGMAEGTDTVINRLQEVYNFLAGLEDGETTTFNTLLNGKVNTTRTIAELALSADITKNALVGALNGTDNNSLALGSHSHSFDNITNRPVSYPPAAHEHNGDQITSGTIDINRLPIASSATYAINDKIPRAGHEHASNKITALTGYTVGTADSEITTTDSLNVALGKLEYKTRKFSLEGSDNSNFLKFATFAGGDFTNIIGALDAPDKTLVLGSNGFDTVVLHGLSKPQWGGGNGSAVNLATEDDVKAVPKVVVSSTEPTDLNTGDIWIQVSA